jgi:MFS family permease
LFTSSAGIIADIYPPMQRAKFMGLFGAIFGIASIIGPALGGFLTDYASTTLFGYEIAGWRWVFYANIPLGLLALAMIVYKTPELSRGNRGTIDFAGSFLLLVVFIPFLLALTWGGSKYDWTSPTLLVMFAVSLVALAIFIWVESRTEEAIMPLNLFQNRVFVITNMSAFVIGMAFLGVIMFMPLFMQVVLGVNATNSGFSMFPLMFGMMLSSILSGRMVSVSGHYKRYMVGGAAVLILGVALLSGINPETSMTDLAWRMVVVGIGLGPSQSLVNIIVQNAFPASQIGVVTSSTQFFRQIGNTVGVAIFGTMLTINLLAELPKQVPALAGAQFNLSTIQSSVMNSDALSSGAIPTAIETGIRLAFSNAITGMFSASLWILLLGFLLSLFIPVLPLHREVQLVADAAD